MLKAEWLTDIEGMAAAIAARSRLKEAQGNIGLE